MSLLQSRLQLGFKQMNEGAHVVDGAVAQKRHRTMGNAAFGFYLTPPNTAMAQTNSVNAQWLRNDDVMHTRLAEITALCQITHTGKAT